MNLFNFILWSIPYSFIWIYLLSIEKYWVVDVSRVLLNQLLNDLWITILWTIFLQIHDNLYSSLYVYVINFFNGEFSVSFWLPLISFVVNFTLYYNTIRDNEGRVETNTKLSNNRLTFLFVLLNKLLATRLSNSTKIFNQLLLSHTYTSIFNN